MHRRTLLRGAAAFALSSPAAAPFVRAAGTTDSLPVRRELVAAAATEPLVGMPYPHTAVLAFGGTVPGPEIRLRRGDALVLDVVNRLDVPTSVHWHGVRAPWAMDGVAGLTQAPVPPGGRFAVDFRVPDAGTYWYHAHANTPEQVGRGLYGPLIVEEETPIAVDRELVWLLDDWRLAPDASIVDDFGRPHDGSHAGRIGNTVTVNGRGGDGRAWPHRVRAGERVRLRLINAANARQFALDFGALPVHVIAVDGQPVRPHLPDGPVPVPSAGRVDLVVDLPPTPSATFDVVDRYYRDPVSVAALALDGRTPVRDAPPDASIDLGAPTLPEPDLGNALEHEIVMRGGAMRGLDRARLGDDWLDGRELAARSRFWALGDLVAAGYEAAPMLIVERGRTVRLSFRNETAFVHPMHLHGHHVKVLSIDGLPPPRPTWHDSVPIVPNGTVEVAFVADNPGRWLLHCHVLEHHMAGMGGLVHVL